MSNHSADHYVPWRKSRIAKLEQVFGKEYFKGKNVLECGAGFGLIGKHLREEWGANVVFTEGREDLVDKILLTNPNAKVHLINHEHPWQIGKFDFIIHWGLLYHLSNWKSDLINTIGNLAPGGVLALESEVLDTEDDKEIKQPEHHLDDDQAISGTGTRPSALRIENELRKNNIKFTRYDDSDLNASFHTYDWKVSNTERAGGEHRRFWICYT